MTKCNNPLASSCCWHLLPFIRNCLFFCFSSINLLINPLEWFCRPWFETRSREPPHLTLAGSSWKEKTNEPDSPFLMALISNETINEFDISYVMVHTSRRRRKHFKARKWVFFFVVVQKKKSLLGIRRVKDTLVASCLIYLFFFRSMDSSSLLPVLTTLDKAPS